MKTLEIHIPDEVASKIKQVAKHMGISIEELLRTSFEEKDPARRAIRECRRSRAREERRALSAALVVRYISIEEVVELHRRIIQQSGGAFELRDQGSLESSPVLLRSGPVSHARGKGRGSRVFPHSESS